MKMSSPLRLTLVFVYLLSAIGVVLCSRPHVFFNSAPEETRNIPFGEEIPERLTLPDLQWLLRNNEIAPVQEEEPPRSRMELVRRDNTVTTKPLNCLNYFWKSRTAC